MKNHHIFIKIGFIIYLLSLAIPARNCGMYDMPIYSYTLVNPRIISDVETMPYVMDFDVLHHTDDYVRYMHTSNNMQEWRDRFCSFAEFADVNYVLYQASISEMETIRAKAKGKKVSLGGKLASNEFAQQLYKNKCTEVIDYLIFAKECEPYATANYSWDGETPDVEEMKDLIVKGRKAFWRTESQFVRLRYAYQVIRLAHYSKDYARTIQLYDKLIPEVVEVESIIKYWALGHKAGALKRLGNRIEASYLFSIVFENCISKREAVFRSFDIKTEKEWNECLSMCHNNEEKATLYFLRALDHNSMAIEDMETIYELTPNSDKLDALLVGEIQKLEKDLLGRDFKDTLYQGQFYKRPEEEAGKYLIQLINLVSKCNAEGKVHNTKLWKVAEAYLEYISGDYYTAKRIFDQAEEYAAEDEQMIQQIEVFKLAMEIHKIKKIDDDVERRLYSMMRDKQRNAIFTDLPRFIQDKMVDLYNKQHDYGKAFLCKYDIEDLKKNPQDRILDDILIMLNTPNPNIFESYLISDKDEEGNPLTTTIINKVLEIKGTLLLSQYNVYEAMSIFRQLPRDYVFSNPNVQGVFNPMPPHKNDTDIDHEERIGFLNDCISCPVDTANFSYKFYDKISLTKRLLELEQLIQTDVKNAAQHSYQLGTAYYNMTYFGRAWFMMDFHRSGSSWYGINKQDVFPMPYEPYGNKENFDCSRALYYFKKSITMAHHNNPELAAQACFMAAKCEQNAFYTSANNTHDPWDKKAPIMPDEYYTFFSLLHEDYKDTDFYMDIIDECAYFDFYVEREYGDYGN